MPMRVMQGSTFERMKPSIFHPMSGFAGFVQPRSGMALKRGLSIANTPGLIDAHYRGELKVIAINLDAHESIHIERGERIAQLVIQEVPVVQLVEVDELDETERGTGGFGSSGAH